MAKLVASVQRAIPLVVDHVRPKLVTFVKYAKVELIPPGPQDIPEIARGFGNLVRGFKSSSWRNLTVREAWLNTLVATEVLMWFFIGEIIGKGSIRGYQV